MQGTQKYCALLTAANQALPNEEMDLKIKDKGDEGYTLAPLFWKRLVKEGSTSDFEMREATMLRLYQDISFRETLIPIFGPVGTWKIKSTKVQVNRYRPGDVLSRHRHHISGGLGGYRLVLVVPIADESPDAGPCLYGYDSETENEFPITTRVGEVILMDEQLWHRVEVNRRRTVFTADIILHRTTLGRCKKVLRSINDKWT